MDLESFGLALQFVSIWCPLLFRSLENCSQNSPTEFSVSKMHVVLEMQLVCRGDEHVKENPVE